MLRSALIAVLVIGAAASEDPSSLQEAELPELAASADIPSSLGESTSDRESASVDQYEEGRPKYAAQELDKADIKKMTAQQQYWFDKAHMGKRWVMHGARKAGELASKAMHKAEQKGQRFQNRIKLASELPNRVAYEQKEQFNRMLGRDVEHPFGNPATIMAGSRDKALRQLGNRVGLHTFLRDMTMTPEQQNHLNALQDAAFEAGKSGKKALLARMGIKHASKPKKDPTKMYRDQLKSMMDVQDENPYAMPHVKGHGCSILDKDECVLADGCRWVQHSCDWTQVYEKTPTHRKLHSNMIKEMIGDTHHSNKPTHNSRTGVRNGHNFYRTTSKNKIWHDDAKSIARLTQTK